MMQNRLIVEGKYELAASLLESPENRCKHTESVVKAKRPVYVERMEKNQNRSVSTSCTQRTVERTHTRYGLLHFQSAALTTAATHSPTFSVAAAEKYPNEQPTDSCQTSIRSVLPSRRSHQLSEPATKCRR
jgi:Tfp pilus assembly protein PilE